MALPLLRPLVSLAIAACTAALAVTASQPAPAPNVATREAAYRANNIGVTRLEQFDFEAAAASFRRALSLDPQLDIARLNLGIALFYAGNADTAQQEIISARASMPDRPQPDYLLGLVNRGIGETAEALEAFRRVETLDPDDVGTAINLGQLYRQERRFPEAIAAFRRALAGAPFNATAAYGLANTLVLAGNADEGREAMARFQKLSESSYAVTYSQTYLEQGRYAEAIISTGAEAALVDVRTPQIAFADATGTLPARPVPPGDRVTATIVAVDIDGDGDLDLVESGPAGLRLYRNGGRAFADVTAQLLGDTAAGPATSVLAGDYDNDGRADLAVLRPAGVALLHARPSGGFADVTAVAELAPSIENPRSAAWVDTDHDGDLDLFVAGGSDAAPATRLFRNNGTGRFTNVATEAGLAVASAVQAVVPTDFDNRRDIDVLVVSTKTTLLFRNERDGTFRDVAGDVGLRVDGGATMAAIGDVNKDGYSDFFFPRPDGEGVLAASDGRGRFAISNGPAGSSQARAAQFVDYDNDGLLDLFVLTAPGPYLLRNVGRSWIDVTASAIPRAMATALAAATSLAAGDFNGDGRIDVAAHGPAGLTLWQNSGPSRATSLGVNLAARVSNRSAIGARVEMRSGSLRQQHAIYSAVPAPAPAGLIFGLGDRGGADVLRVLWPSGILQAETGAQTSDGAVAPIRGAVKGAAPIRGAIKGAAPIRGAIKIEELDRKPSSCPYLYTWNGERFEFITDFLGGGEMGYWLAPGARNTPDPDEYVRIAGDRLRARDGRYELRITNELEESLFLDRVQLVAVAHPRGVEVHPNEGLVPETRPFTLYSARLPQPPTAAHDARGRDMLDRLRAIDRRYADGFALERVRGYAAEHTLTLTLPPPGPGGRRLLLMTGWTDYAFSGDNVAAHQAGLRLLPPSLEIKAADGTWKTAIEDIGMPVGRPQTVAVDLSAAVPAATNEVRIRTSMRIYWDQILVDSSDGRAPVSVTRLDPVTANLRWRGFSTEQASDGREPYTYDYDRVSPDSPWKLLPGRYTREGDVRPLLLGSDDMFVVSRPGDEIAIAFDATALAPLPEGWTRTFLLYADGFSKEMNLHSSSPDTLLPLPFHGMTQYPYAAPEAYPSTPAHREYLERYNTRVVPRAVPSLDRILDVERRAPR